MAQQPPQSVFVPPSAEELQGPFAQYLTPRPQQQAPTVVPTPPAPRGSMSKGASIAYLMENFLAGASEARTKQFAQQQNERMQKLATLASYVDSVQNDPSLSEEAKAYARKRYFDALGGSVLSEDAELSKAAGKGKGGGKSGEPQGFLGHFGNILKEIAQGATGGKMPKGVKDIGDPQAIIGQIYAEIQKPQYSQTAAMQKKVDLDREAFKSYTGRYPSSEESQQIAYSRLGVKTPMVRPAMGKPMSGEDISRFVNGRDASGAPIDKSKSYLPQFENGKIVNAFPSMPSTTGGRPGQGTQVVSVDQAKALQQQGFHYRNEDQTEIDLNKLPAGVMLQPIFPTNKPPYYIPFDPRYSTFSVGGQSYIVPPQLAGGIAQGTVPPAGPSKTGQTTYGGEWMFSPEQGQYVWVPKMTTTVPETPGANVKPQGTQPPPATVVPPTQPPPSQAAPTQAPTSEPPKTTGAPEVGQSKYHQATEAAKAPPAATTAAARPPVTPTTVSGKPIPTPVMPEGVVPTAEYNRNRPNLVAVREGYRQILGDPTQPEFRPLSSYVDLVDKPDSKKRLKQAFQIWLGEYDAARRSPGFFQFVEDLTGMTNYVRETQANVRARAVQNLTPEEQYYFDSAMSAFATSIGLRTLTKGSAAKFSATAIEREIPLIGLNAQTRYQFYDQLSRLAEAVYTGADSIPRAMFHKGEFDHMKAAPADMRRKRDAAEKAAKGASGAEDRVKVKSPDGTMGTIPRSKLKQAQAQGYTEVQ